jgi:hypothetical protein
MAACDQTEQSVPCAQFATLKRAWESDRLLALRGFGGVMSSLIVPKLEQAGLTLRAFRATLSARILIGQG